MEINMDYTRQHSKQNLKQQYLQQSVMTATPAELLIMLYDACIKNLKLAEICLTERHDLDGSNTHFIKAQKIIMELVTSLDTSYEISASLLEIYNFLLRTIRDMNIKKEVTLLPQVLEILTSLRDTWETAAKLQSSSSEVG
jgi:flagellar protein FliS